MQKLNIPKTILTATLLIAFTLIAGLSIFGFSEIKKTRDFPVDFIEPVKPAEKNNNNQEPAGPVELETYEAELFVEAKWGSEDGEVGIFVSGGDAGGAGPVYGPQSFDVDDKTGYLYLLDSVNERVLEYDEKGKYLRDFPIACGGTGDIRISPDGEFLYVFSWRCEAIYKYNILGEFLEEYKVLPNEKERPTLSLGGLSFDGSENVMLELEIEDYFKGDRFYQIGINEDEWESNSYIGYISNNKEEYYLSDGKRIYYTIKKTNPRNSKKTERHILILNKEGLPQKEIDIKFLEEVHIYFIGFGRNNSFYLDVCYNDNYNEEIHKYNKEGRLLAIVGINKFLKMKAGEINKESNIYASYFKNFRVDKNDNVYYMFTFKNEGLKVFKYSKVE